MSDKKNGISKGFTMIELLATIGIIAVIFGVAGYFAISTINKSKKESDALALNNIKKTASVYSQEYPNNVVWNEKTGTDDKFSCVPVEMLVNKGYVKREDVNNRDVSEYVVLTKNVSNTIIDEEFDNNGTCGSVMGYIKVSIPTRKKYCNDLVYSGSEQVLTSDSADTIANKFSFSGNRATNAGDYNVVAKLNPGHTWSDNTIEDKVIKCTINKKKPNVYFDPNGQSGSTIGKHQIMLKTDVPGGVSFTSSNLEYVSVDDASTNINDTITTTINVLSTRSSVITYITANLKPTDSVNYSEESAVYTVGDPKRKKVNKPTSSLCLNPYYNGGEQNLVKESTEKGYNLYNITGTDIGKYTITARLDYGYTWQDGSVENATFECEIKRPTPTITYDANEGKACNPKTKVVVYESPYGELCAPTRRGYNFVGWYKSKDWSTKVDADTKVTDFNNHTLYAKWEPKVYTVNFYSNGGTGNMNSMKCTYDSKCTFTANSFTRTGYTYAGWTTKSNGKDDGYGWKDKWSDVWKYIDGENGVSKGTLNLYARWNINKYYLDVKPTNGISSFNISGVEGSGNNLTSYRKKNNFETIATISNIKAKTGYTYTGYTLSGSLTTVSGSTNTSIKAQLGAGDGAVTLNSKANTYVIKFNGNGSTGGSTASKTCTYDQDCVLTTNGFSKTGYSFSGWATSASGSVVYTDGKKVKNLATSGEITLYAKWTANTYKIKFNGNGSTGGSTAAKTCTYDKDCVLTSNGFTKTGYKFAGWATSASGNVVHTDGKTVKNLATSGTVTLYAKWTANTYTIKFDGNGATGGSTSAKTCTYDKDCTLTTNGFSKTGYSFSGWATSASGNVAYANGATVKNLATSGEVKLYAKWTANTYTIKFDGNGSTGGSTASKTCTYDQNCVLTSNGFSKTGYNFGGWATSSSGAAAYSNGATVKNLATSGSITLYANWKANTYTINFNGNGNTGGSTASKTCTYDQDCVLTSNGFSRTGHTFAGWATSSSGAVVHANGKTVKNLATDGSITLYAKWTVNRYYFDVNPDSGISSFNISGVEEPGTGLNDYWKQNNYGTIGTITNVKAKPGYTYTGYTLTGSLSAVSGSTNSNIKAMLGVGDGAVVLNSKPNAYTMTYNNNGGSGCSSKTVTYGAQYGSLCTPTRSGYTFIGWFDSGYKDSPLNYYADTNTDLKNAFGYNQDSLYSHWINNGKSEGRRISQYVATDTVNKTSNFTVYAGWKRNGCPDGQHEFLLQGTKIHTVTWGYYKDTHGYHDKAHYVYCTKCHMSAIEYNKTHGGYTTTGISDLLCPDCPNSASSWNTCIGAFVLNHGKAAVGFWDD